MRGRKSWPCCLCTRPRTGQGGRATKAGMACSEAPSPPCSGFLCPRRAGSPRSRSAATTCPVRLGWVLLSAIFLLCYCVVVLCIHFRRACILVVAEGSLRGRSGLYFAGFLLSAKMIFFENGSTKHAAVDYAIWLVFTVSLSSRTSLTLCCFV